MVEAILAILLADAVPDIRQVGTGARGARDYEFLAPLQADDVMRPK